MDGGTTDGTPRPGDMARAEGTPRAEDAPRWENRITGGTFGNVVLAERVDAVHIHVHEEPAAPPRSPLRLLVLTALLACAGAVLWAAPPGVLGPAASGGRLAAPAALCAAALAGSAAVGRIRERRRLRERGSRARPRTPLPGHRLDRAAEGLAEALTRQYGREDQLALSPVSTPTPIPVRWQAADPLVTDHAPNLLADGSAGALEAEGEFAGAAAFFTRLPRQRLVVLGEPGAGKTVLAQRLARTLLEARGPASAAPVPVVLPLASWDPRGPQGLWRWAAERLCAEHPVPLPTPEAALDLIASGRVLPVLDGFDELPLATQPEALRQLRASLTEHARCVLTSRTAEYTRAVDGAALPLPGAVAVELCPLTTDDLARYLPRTSRRTSRSDPSRTKWAPVLARLADPDDTARETRVLRRVLSTPLMVALARVAYSETDADPAELLGAGRFTTRQAVERHLYDAFLTAAYTDAGRERAERARGWAAFLAAHTRRFGGQEIAWWRLEEALPGWVRRLSVLPAAAVATFTVSRMDLGTPPWAHWQPVPVPVPLWAVFGAGVCAFAWGEYGGGTGRAPQQARLPRPSDLRQTPRWKLTGTLAGWAALLGFVAYAAGSDGGPDAARLAVLIVAVFALRSLVRWPFTHARTPADPETAAEPARLLRRDRRVTLATGFAVRNTEGDPGLLWVLPWLLLAVWQIVGGRDVVTGWAWTGTVAGATLSTWLYENAVSAWGRYTLARVWFAATGRLPWHLMDFLREAHAKGVLRQAGGVYRFRHIELRNRLAADIPEAATPEAGVPEPARYRRWAAALRAALRDALPGAVAGLGVLLLLATGIGLLNTPPVPGPHPYPRAGVVCAALSRDVLGELMADPRRVFRPAPLRKYPEGAGDGTCAADERAPFRPEVRVSVKVSTWAGDLSADGTAQAAEQFAVVLHNARTEQRGNSKLAREDRDTTVDTSPSPADEAVRRVYAPPLVPGAGSLSLPRATYTARDANRIVTVDYAEEYASHDRLAAVAESLLRRSLGRDDGRDLAAVPRGPEPPEDSRLGRYRRPEHRLHGAVWGKGERSFVWDVGGLAFPFRAPKDIDCNISDARPDDGTAYDCVNLTGRDLSYQRVMNPALGSGPRLRLHVAQLDCGKECPDKKARAFAESRPGAVRLPWRRSGDGTAFYAVRRTEKTYELTMWGTFRVVSGERRQLWVRARVDRDDAGLAQKIVNSAYTQVGGEG
ncbi:NACHT domain-containing protein [Streptomyces sp. NPDC054796]